MQGKQTVNHKNILFCKNVGKSMYPVPFTSARTLPLISVYVERIYTVKSSRRFNGKYWQLAASLTGACNLFTVIISMVGSVGQGR